MKERILELVEQLGPIVPSEITSKFETNSMIISALISELIKEGKLFYSRKKVGTSPLYYVKGQEDKVRKRLLPELKIPERKIVEFFEEKKLALRANMSPQQRFMVDELSDFITPITLNINGQDQVFYKHFSVSTQSLFDELNKPKPKSKPLENKTVHQESLFSKPEIKQEVIKPKIEQARKEQLEQENDSFDDLSEQFFTKYNLSLIESKTVKKSKEANFVVQTGYRIPQTYFIKYLKKKTVNDNDVSKAYAEAQMKKMPCLIITIGKLNKKAQELKNSLGSLVTIMRL